MRKFGFCLTLMAVMTCGLGCSQETIEKAGDAANSAAEDTAENLDAVGDEIKEAVGDDDETPETVAPEATE